MSDHQPDDRFVAVRTPSAERAHPHAKPSSGYAGERDQQPQRHEASCPVAGTAAVSMVDQHFTVKPETATIRRRITDRPSRHCGGRHDPRQRSRVRVLVTGGGGVLASRLVERLRDAGDDVVAVRRHDYDLTAMDDTARLFADGARALYHLAAEVGGTGANRASPGRYWYANLLMGAHVLEQARLSEKPKLLIAGTSLRVS